MAKEPKGPDQAPKGSGQDPIRSDRPGPPSSGLPLNPTPSPVPGPFANPKVRLNDYNDTDLTASESEPGCTARGPGSFSLYTSVRKLLIQIAEKRGWTTAEIKFIRVANVEGQRRIWLYPTDESDRARIPLRISKGKYSVTLSRYLKKWGLLLPSDERRWYDILQDTQNESPIGPAVYIDLDKPRDFKKVTTPSKDESQGTSKGKGKTEPTDPEPNKD